MLYFFALLFFSCLLLWHFVGRKKTEEAFDRSYDNWGLLIEQKSQYLIMTNFTEYFIFITFFLVSLFGSIFKINIYYLIFGSYIILIIAAIISLFEPANISYEGKDIKNDMPFRIWNYLAFKGMRKLNIELCGIFLPNPTTPDEKEKVITEIESLSQEQKQKIIEALKSSKFKRVSHRANKTIVNWIFKFFNWAWAWVGLTSYSLYTWIKNTYFDGSDKALMKDVTSNFYKYLLAIILLIIVYICFIKIIDKLTTKNRKDFARETLFELFDIKE